MHYTHLTHKECDEELFLETQRAMEFKRRLKEWVQEELDQARQDGRWDRSESEYREGISEGKVEAFEDALKFLESGSILKK